MKLHASNRFLVLLVALVPPLARGLTHAPRLLFISQNNIRSLFNNILEHSCGSGFHSINQNFQALGVFDQISTHEPCQACQATGANENAHCCEAYDETTGVCSCGKTYKGVGMDRMKWLCKEYKGRFCYVHGEVTGMYGNDYTYRQTNITTACIPQPGVRCSIEGIRQVLTGFAQQCVDGNTLIDAEARCTFRLCEEGEGLPDPSDPDKIIEFVVTAAAPRGAAPNLALVAAAVAASLLLQLQQLAPTPTLARGRQWAIN